MKVTPASLQAAADGNMENFIAASTPGGIEAQEAEGQKCFVASQTLPKDCPREDLEKIGFIFGDDEDDIFISVQFPEGWSKKPTEHSMWSDLIDDKGRGRGGIFYKAAFYDRSANLKLQPRFSFRQDYDQEDCVQYLVLDAGTTIFKTDKIECEKYSEGYWKATDDAQKNSEIYLNDNYPDWRDRSAYWD